MADIGHYYGSEWHLLRYLGRHRLSLESRIASLFSTEAIEWLDYPTNPVRKSKDQEWQGLKFLPKSMSHIRQAWESYWPRTGSEMNWDAVAWSRSGSTKELLLFEAKANLSELRSDCAAKETGGRPAIRVALNACKSALKIEPSSDWLTNYYQYANRLVVLNFLLQHGLPTRMVFIYFMGDDNGPSCPKSIEEWRPELEKQKTHLGLDRIPPLRNVYELFLPTCISEGSIS